MKAGKPSCQSQYVTRQSLHSLGLIFLFRRKRAGKLQNRRLSCTKNKVATVDQYLGKSFTVSAAVPPTSMEIFLPARHTSPSNVSLSQNVLHLPPRSPPGPREPNLLCLACTKITFPSCGTFSLECSPLWISHPQFSQFCLPWCIFYVSAHSCFPPLVPFVWGRGPGDPCPAHLFYRFGLPVLHPWKDPDPLHSRGKLVIKGYA